jgi:co-chaperonin GroES (HSP10)
MEINDKRKFTEDGELREPKESVEVAEFDKNITRLLSEVPMSYDDALPLTNHVLVKQAAAETTYAGTRFVIPDAARQSPNEGVVVAIGPEVNPVDNEGKTIKHLVRLAPGDLVTFGRFNAEPIMVNDEEFQLVRFEDIKLRQRVTYAIHA